MSHIEPPKLTKEKFGVSKTIFEMPLHPTNGVNFQLPFAKDGSNATKFDIKVCPLGQNVSIKTIRKIYTKRLFRRNLFKQGMTERIENLITPQQKISIFSDKVTYDVIVNLEAGVVTVEVSGEKFIYW
ncbi:hypothetical protein II582_04690 [bacterium]|nr:hypothetical protein [bacterium]